MFLLNLHIDFRIITHSLVCVSLLDADPYGITNKRKRKEVSVESFYSDRIPLSVWHEVKGLYAKTGYLFALSVLSYCLFHMYPQLNMQAADRWVEPGKCDMMSAESNMSLIVRH